MAKKTNWMKKADGEWRRIIREVGECEMCGKEGIRAQNGGWLHLFAHHIIKRSELCYRHDLSNGVCLCYRCHKREPWSPHVDLARFLDWLNLHREGQYKWYMEHAVEEDKQVGKNIIKVRKAIRMKRERSYREDYELLKEIKK